jgi:outer membrane protein assembly factor BamB
VEFLMRRDLVIVVLFFLAGILSSCSSRYRMNRDALTQPSFWPTQRADIAGTGSISSDDYSGKLDLLWQGKINDRPVGPLALAHGQLAIPGSRKRIWFFECDSGKRLGKLKVSGIPQGGLTLQDSVAYLTLAHPRNRLVCTDLIHRQNRWQARIKDAAFGPIIVGNRLITSSNDGVVTALDPKTGKQIWRYQNDSRLLGPVSAADGRLFAGSDDGSLFAISESDGTELYRVNLRSPIVSAVAIAEYIYVADVGGHLHALSPADGTVAWRVSLPSSTWTAPAVSDGRVFAACRNGDVIALDALTGREIWRYAAVDVVKGSPIVVGKYLVVGTMTGALLTLATETGAVAGQTKVQGAVAWSPISDGSRIYVATQTGRVFCFGDLHEQRSQENH